jgi:hypothetical protein
METDEEKLKRLIADEYDTISKLKEKKKDLDIQIDNCIKEVDRYRARLWAGFQPD